MWTTYFVLLMMLTHMPIPAQVAAVTSPMDKSLHLAAYGLLTALTVALFMNWRIFAFPQKRILVGLVTIAALDEILQGPVGRCPEVMDWLFDCAGIGLGLLSSQLLVWWIAHQGVVLAKRFELKVDA